MIRILKSLAIITAVVAIAGGGTYALWNDSAKIIGSTFSAGNQSIKVDANPDSGVQQWEESFTVPAEYYVKNLYPGFPSNRERNYQVIDIKNDGDFKGTASFKFERTSAWSDLSNKLIFTVYFEGNEVAKGTLDELNNQIKSLGTLDAQEANSVRFEWNLPSDVTNEVQGDTIIFDVVFGLEQIVT